MLYGVILLSWPLAGQETSDSDDKMTWWAPQFEYNQKQTEIFLSGQDSIRAWLMQGDTRINAEKIFWNRSTRIGRCYNRVEIISFTNDSVITGDEAWHYANDTHTLVRGNPVLTMNKSKIVVYAEELHRYGGNSARSEAIRNVRIESEDGTGYAEKAVFYQRTGQIVLSEDPWIVQKTNIHRADEITLYRDDNRVVLRGHARMMLERDYIRANEIEIIDYDQTNTSAASDSKDRKNRIVFCRGDVRIYRHTPRGELESITSGDYGELYEQRGYAKLIGQSKMVMISDNTITGGAVMEQFQDEDLAVVKGNANITRGYRGVDAQLIIYNTKTKIAEITGSPVIREYGDFFRADYVLYDTQRDTISWRGSTMAVVGTGDQRAKQEAWINKTGGGMYTLSEGQNGLQVIKSVGNVWLSMNGIPKTNAGVVSYGKRADEEDFIPRGTHIVIRDSWSWIDFLAMDGMMLRLRGPAHCVLSAAAWKENKGAISSRAAVSRAASSRAATSSAATSSAAASSAAVSSASVSSAAVSSASASSASVSSAAASSASASSASASSAATSSASASSAATSSASASSAAASSASASSASASSAAASSAATSSASASSAAASSAAASSAAASSAAASSASASSAATSSASASRASGSIAAQQERAVSGGQASSAHSVPGDSFPDGYEDDSEELAGRLGQMGFTLNYGIMIAKPGRNSVTDVQNDNFFCTNISAPFLIDADREKRMRMIILTNQDLTAWARIPSLKSITLRNDEEKKDFASGTTPVFRYAIPARIPVYLLLDQINTNNFTLNQHITNALAVRKLEIEEIAASNAAMQIQESPRMITNRILVQAPQRGMIENFIATLTNVAATNYPDQPFKLVIPPATRVIPAALRPEIYWEGDLRTFVLRQLAGKNFWGSEAFPRRQTDYYDLISETETLDIRYGPSRRRPASASGASSRSAAQSGSVSSRPAAQSGSVSSRPAARPASR
jgi:lipopolysaccharide export system protein LptA